MSPFLLLNLLLPLLPPGPIIISAHANVHIVKIRPESTTDGLKTKRAVCELPLAIGNCTRKFTRFYWDIARGNCYKFVYSGCGGNGNRFLSRHQCKKRCSLKFREKHKKSKISARLSIRQRDDEQCPSNCTNGICARGKCQCRKGFEWAGGGMEECIDVNECHWTKCAQNARCVNLPGSFRCECFAGFAGSGFNCTKERGICGQLFDRRYEHNCQPGLGEWKPRWHFHLHSGHCRQFWWGGCQFGESQNFFPDIQSCQSICGGFSHEEFFATEIDQKVHKENEEVTNGANSQKNISENPCMDPFDDSLRRPCTDGIWKRRYFYDPSASRCHVFWMDASCPRGNMMARNVFSNLMKCKRTCQGDTTDWAVEKWRQNGGGGGGGTSGVIQASFWRNESQAKNWQNVRREEEDCKETTMADTMLAWPKEKKREKMARLKAKMKAMEREGGRGMASACLDKFDWNLTKNCGNGPWKVQFFFDHRLAKCRPFWNNGCSGGRSRNHFEEAKMCKMCENGGKRGGGEVAKDGMKMMDDEDEDGGGGSGGGGGGGSGVCADQFDDNYRRACHNGKGWRRRWFFDQPTGFCRYFWYDGCKGRSRNIFEGLKECMDMCMGGGRGVENHREAASSAPKVTTEPAKKRQFVYFGSGEIEKTGFWSVRKNYLRSAQLSLDEMECTGFRYNATGKARLSTFFCLLEEGGACQSTVLFANNGAEQCHQSRPWLRGKHSYVWFFTLERNPLMEPMAEGIPVSSGVLTLRQNGLNLTTFAVVPIEPFGQQNETIAWIDLLPSIPIDHCHC